jgi:hypothetical protein
VAVFSLANASIWAGGYDFTGDSNKLTLHPEAEDLDTTVFQAGTGPGWRSRIAGLFTNELAVDGNWQSATAVAPDPQIFTNLGVADLPYTVSPDGQAGTVAYMFQAAPFSYEAFGEVGALAPFSLNAMGTNGVGMVRGTVAKAKAAVAATGALGSAAQLGAVGAAQFLYATFHVFSAGTTITAVLESDDSNTFSSATTQQTIGPLTTTGGTWVVRTAGAITDDWYRLRVSAITGSFTVAAAFGIR